MINYLNCDIPGWYVNSGKHKLWKHFHMVLRAEEKRKSITFSHHNLWERSIIHSIATKSKLMFLSIAKISEDIYSWVNLQQIAMAINFEGKFIFQSDCIHINIKILFFLKCVTKYL